MHTFEVCWYKIYHCAHLHIYYFVRVCQKEEQARFFFSINYAEIFTLSSKFCSRIPHSSFEESSEARGQLSSRVDIAVPDPFSPVLGSRLWSQRCKAGLALLCTPRDGVGLTLALGNTLQIWQSIAPEHFLIHLILKMMALHAVAGLSYYNFPVEYSKDWHYESRVSLSSRPSEDKWHHKNQTSCIIYVINNTCYWGNNLILKTYTHTNPYIYISLFCHIWSSY